MFDETNAYEMLTRPLNIIKEDDSEIGWDAGKPNSLASYLSHSIAQKTLEKSKNGKQVVKQSFCTHAKTGLEPEKTLSRIDMIPELQEYSAIMMKLLVRKDEERKLILLLQQGDITRLLLSSFPCKAAPYKNDTNHSEESN